MVGVKQIFLLHYRNKNVFNILQKAGSKMNQPFAFYRWPYLTFGLQARYKV